MNKIAVLTSSIIAAASMGVQAELPGADASDAFGVTAEVPNMIILEVNSDLALDVTQSYMYSGGRNYTFNVKRNGPDDASQPFELTMSSTDAVGSVFNLKKGDEALAMVVTMRDEVSYKNKAVTPGAVMDFASNHSLDESADDNRNMTMVVKLNERDVRAKSSGTYATTLNLMVAAK